jgi:hypothetical protein
MPKHDQMKNLMNEEELLEVVVGLTSRQLKEFRDNKVIPFIKVKRTLLYDPAKVLAALENNHEIKATGVSK